MMAFKTLRPSGVRSFVRRWESGKVNVIPLCRISNFMHVMTLDLIKSANDEYMHIQHSYKSILQGHGAIHLVYQSSSMSQMIFRHLELIIE